MAQLVFVEPLIMLWSISHPPDQVSCAPTLGPVPQEALHFVLGFTLDFHWLRGSS